MRLNARLVPLSVVLGVSLTTAPALAQDGQAFDPGCAALPFTAQNHPIDTHCGIEGKLTDADKRIESRAKNNLCATGSATW
jgi:hypothetical protein